MLLRAKVKKVRAEHPTERPHRRMLGAQAGRAEEGELGHDERHTDDVLRSGGQKRK